MTRTFLASSHHVPPGVNGIPDHNINGMRYEDWIKNQHLEASPIIFMGKLHVNVLRNAKNHADCPYVTTKSTVKGCALSEAVHLEPLLDHILIAVQDLNRC
jgi:hypothetical protein